MSNFQLPKSIESNYAFLLRKVARVVAGIIDSFTIDGDIVDERGLEKSLTDYSNLLDPWANAIVEKTLLKLSKTNEQMWLRASRKIGKGIEYQIKNAPMNFTFDELKRKNVELIKSLPIETLKKAQDLASKSIYQSTRADQIEKEISNLGNFTKNRSKIIARTEIARANSLFTQTRAEAIGVETYVWETMEDASVRPSHAQMQGTIHRFDTDPYVEGEGYHGPGQFPYCRCYPAPIL